MVEDANGLWRREEVMGAKASVEARRMGEEGGGEFHFGSGLMIAVSVSSESIVALSFK